MNDAECIDLLQWALPRLNMRWPGFRRVCRLVCRRVSRRLRELGLPGLADYRARLEDHPEEWQELDALCRIPISRFYRDRVVFEGLEREVLAALAGAAIADGRRELACWSACCASGEEAYTVAILWNLRRAHPQLRLRVVATDIDAHLLERARIGCYRASSLKALPAEMTAAAFSQRGDELCVRDAFRGIEFLQQDIRRSAPEGQFDIVLCRNAALTYFAAPLQREVAQRLLARLRPGGALVIGIHETLPEGLAGLAGIAPWAGQRAIYRKEGFAPR